MTTTSQVTVVGVGAVMDLLQNNHWTDGGRPVCGDKSVPEHGVQGPDFQKILGKTLDKV